ncbi:MAG: RNA polymerase sigma factor [Mycobacteriales bacterium]
MALHYFGDQPLAQIATTLGVPPGTVKRRLHEARNRLGAAAQLAPLKEGSDE